MNLKLLALGFAIQQCNTKADREQQQLISLNEYIFLNIEAEFISHTLYFAFFDRSVRICPDLGRYALAKPCSVQRTNPLVPERQYIREQNGGCVLPYHSQTKGTKQTEKYDVHNNMFYSRNKT